MTPEKQKLLDETYIMFMDLMLGDLPLDSVNDLAVEDVTGYGSTVDEKINDINRLRRLVIDQRKQSAGIDITVDTKQVQRRISPGEDTAIFIDEIEVTIKTDEGKNVLNLRLSIIFEFINERWKVVHMHGSTGVKTDGDTWHIDEWKKKMEELQKLVDEKTAELKNKNRELEIEAALERVRARSMGMHHSRELIEVVRLLDKETRDLGIKVDGTQIATDFSDPEEGTKVWLAVEGMGYLEKFHIPKLDSPVISKFHTLKDGQNFFTEKYSKAERNRFFRLIYKHSDFKRIPKERQAATLETPGGWIRSTAINKNSALTFQRFGSNPFSEEENAMLIRFGAVFEQAFTRFLDLQKAEAQAREAQIEAALERVRARSMGMHKSKELRDVVRLLYKEFRILVTDIDSVNIQLNLDSSKDINFWASVGEDIYPELYHLPYVDLPIFEKLYNAFNSPGEGFFDYLLNKKEKDAFFNEIFNVQPVPPGRKKMIQNAEGMVIMGWFHKYSGIDIARYNLKRFSEEEKNTVKRFAAAFEQTYTRFLDLKKAEAQAREAEIQLALERVRARTMAMHKSDELAETAAILFKQMTELGVTPERLNICLIKEADNILEVWATDQQGIKISHHFNASLDEPTTGKRLYHAWKEKKKSIIIDLSGKELNDWIRYVREVMGMTIKAELVKEHRIHSVAFFSQGMILTTTPQPLPEESIKLLERFADVFNLTYRRFLDLKQAEAQAREAEIQLALERVRARTMAMQKSEELAEVAGIVFNQLTKLGVEHLASGVSIIDKNKPEGQMWMSYKGDMHSEPFTIDFNSNPVLSRVYKSWKDGEPFFINQASGQEFIQHIKFLIKVFGERVEQYLETTKKQFKDAGKEIPSQMVMHHTFFSNGSLLLNNTEPIKEQEILNRFAKVFDQTYTRFLDLKQAEAQAREAKIEAALERVRAKAMAMHSTDDLALTVDTFFSELNQLNVMPHRCGVGIINAETRIVDITATAATDENKIKTITGKLKLAGHPVLDKVFENWKLQKEYHPVLRGKEILEYYKVMNPQVEFPDFAGDETQYGYYFYFKEGGVFAWCENGLPEEDLNIFRRFTSVLSLTYRRYLDLKDAEARAVEAVKQASLDRVRAEIASMRTTEDLQQITPIIWRELKALEVPFIRCGVFIVDEAKESVGVFLTTPDGNALGVLHLAFDSNDLTSNTVKHWKKKQVYKEHWNKEEFINWTKSMMELGQVQSQETYQGSSTPPESLHLHFVPFTQGMLYVGDVKPLIDEKLDLVKTLAKAFSMAYARYEDFNRVESANEELNNLSSELKIKNDELENENERKAIELEEARELQLAMLPKEIPQHPGLDIKVYMQTATEVGGDYYDFSSHIDGSFNVAIGDATGHGMKAGTLVTMMKSLFVANSAGKDIEGFFTSSNAAIKNSNLKRMMAGFAMLNISDHKAKYINAGMPSVYHYKKNEGNVEEIKQHNLPLGAMKIEKYNAAEINLNKGDVLLLMTDGFPELHNLSNELYGYERVFSSFEKVGAKEPEEIIKHLNEESKRWRKEKELQDDVTFVVVKIK